MVFINQGKCGAGNVLRIDTLPFRYTLDEQGLPCT